MITQQRQEGLTRNNRNLKRKRHDSTNGDGSNKPDQSHRHHEQQQRQGARKYSSFTFRIISISLLCSSTFYWYPKIPHGGTSRLTRTMPVASASAFDATNTHHHHHHSLHKSKKKNANQNKKKDKSAVDAMHYAPPSLSYPLLEKMKKEQQKQHSEEKHHHHQNRPRILIRPKQKQYSQALKNKKIDSHRQEKHNAERQQKQQQQPKSTKKQLQPKTKRPKRLVRPKQTNQNMYTSKTPASSSSSSSFSCSSAKIYRVIENRETQKQKKIQSLLAKNEEPPKTTAAATIDAKTKRPKRLIRPMKQLSSSSSPENQISPKNQKQLVASVSSSSSLMMEQNKQQATTSNNNDFFTWYESIAVQLLTNAALDATSNFRDVTIIRKTSDNNNNIIGATNTNERSGDTKMISSAEENENENNNDNVNRATRESSSLYIGQEKASKRMTLDTKQDELNDDENLSSIDTTKQQQQQQELSSPATTTTSSNDSTKTNNNKQKHQHHNINKQKQQRKYHPYPHEQEGARILSSTFASTSKLLGKTADTVRVVGDTTADVIGSSSRLVGLMIKGMGVGLDYLGSGLMMMEVEGQENMEGFLESKKETKMIQQKERDSSSTTTTTTNTRFVTNSQRMAGSGVRLVGSAIQGIGNSFLLAGTVTETLASSTASVAEDSIRMMSDVTNFIADEFKMVENDEHSSASGGGGTGEGLVNDNVVGSQQEEFEGMVDETSSEHTTRIEEKDEKNDNDNKENDMEKQQKESNSWIAYGSYYDVLNEGQEIFSIASLLSRRATSLNEEKDNYPIKTNGDDDRIISNIANHMSNYVTEFMDFALLDTQGVPSFIYELLGVMVICYITTLFLLSNGSHHSEQRKKSVRSRKDKQQEERYDQMNANYGFCDHCSENNMNGEGDIMSVADETAVIGPTSSTDQVVPTVTAEVIHPMAHQQHGYCHRHHVHQHHFSKPQYNSKQHTTNLPCPLNFILWLIQVPWKCAFFMLRFWWNFIFNRKMALLVVYIFAIFYLTRTSQLRSVAIQRNAEAAGFRSAIASIGTTSFPEIESAAWLNALLTKIWRVPYDNIYDNEAANNDIKCKCPISSSSNILKKQSSCVCPDELYGGLEPYISSRVNAAIVDALNLSQESRPSDVAYISVESFTLGNVPPIVRSIELLGGQEDGKILHFGLDVDMLLETSSLVLEIKLSSLKNSLLPSTKLSVSLIDMRIALDASVTVMPEFPFISFVNLSLYKLPTFKIKIVPLSEDSGLRGIDLGSLPVLNTWIQDAIEASLEEYITPRYISIDIPYFIYGEEKRGTSRGDFHRGSSFPTDGGVVIDDMCTELPHMFSAAHEAAIADHKDPICRNHQSTASATTMLFKKFGAGHPLRSKIEFDIMSSSSTNYTVNPYFTNSDKTPRLFPKQHDIKQTRHIVRRNRMPVLLKDVTERISGPLKAIAPFAVALGAASLHSVFSSNERNN